MIADSISDLKSRLSRENDEEDEIRTDEEALEEEIEDVLDKEETVKEELSYAPRKKMKYYPQAINHTKEILEELEDSEKKAEKVEELIEDVEHRISQDEQEIEGDIQEIESQIQSIRDLEERLKGLFSDLEHEMRKKDAEPGQAAEKIIEILEEQQKILQGIVEHSRAFQKNSNGLYPVMGRIYDLADAVRNEEQELEKLREEVKEFEDIFEHLETAEQHSVQLIKKEQSMKKVENSESVKHTKEAIEKGNKDDLAVYSDKESARVVEEEAREIRNIEERTSEAAEKVNQAAEKVEELENKDRNFTEQFQEITSALEDAEETVNSELEEAERFERMFLSAREELEEAMSKHEEHDIDHLEQYQELDEKMEIYRAIHDQGRGEELERIFNGDRGVITLLEKVKDVVDMGLEEAEKVSGEKMLK